MRKVTDKVRKAESLLKKAEKENVRLANYDERVRDPEIKKLHKLEKGNALHHSRNSKRRKAS